MRLQSGSILFLDTRVAQMERVANYLERHPNATGKAIDAACDTGSFTKVISEMRRSGYGVARDWCYEPCDTGHATRRVRAYRLLFRPSTQPDLFPRVEGKA